MKILVLFLIMNLGLVACNAEKNEAKKDPTLSSTPSKDETITIDKNGNVVKVGTKSQGHGDPLKKETKDAGCKLEEDSFQKEVEKASEGKVEINLQKADSNCEVK